MCVSSAPLRHSRELRRKDEIFTGTFQVLRGAGRQPGEQEQHFVSEDTKSHDEN